MHTYCYFKKQAISLEWEIKPHRSFIVRFFLCGLVSQKLKSTNMNKDILIYKYNYQLLDLNMEGEFFLSYLTNFNFSSKEKYIENFILPKSTFFSFFKEIKPYIESDKTPYQLNDDLHKKRLMLIREAGYQYITVPPWLVKLSKEYKLGVPITILLADIYSFENNEQDYFKSQENIAGLLGVHVKKISTYLSKLKSLELISVQKTKTINIIKLTDKFYSYGSN